MVVTKQELYFKDASEFSSYERYSENKGKTKSFNLGIEGSKDKMVQGKIGIGYSTNKFVNIEKSKGSVNKIGKEMRGKWKYTNGRLEMVESEEMPERIYF